ncbi:MAG: fimbria/pilus outer membrane usher protein [Steroidobacteraceae bacterium]
MAQHYAAGLLGLAVNTEAGAVAIDVTEARAALSDTHSSSGQSLRISYSKLIRATQTNLALSTYRYSSDGYYSFSDAQTVQQAGSAGAGSNGVDRARSSGRSTSTRLCPDAGETSI